MLTYSLRQVFQSLIIFNDLIFSLELINRSDAGLGAKYSLEKMQGDTTRVLSVPHFNVNKVISVTILGETIATTNFEIDNNTNYTN